MADAGAYVATPGLSPEEWALLRTIIAIPDEEDREAFLLQNRNELTIGQIATVQSVSKGSVEWRLLRARRTLQASFRNERH